MRGRARIGSHGEGEAIFNLFGEPVIPPRLRYPYRKRRQGRRPWNHPLQPELPRLLDAPPRSLSALPDIDLCRLAQTGDRTAEAEVVARWKYLADFAAVDYRVNGLDAVDMVSVAHLAIVKAVRTYRTPSVTFEAYARLLIGREVISQARKAARRPKMTLGAEATVEESSDRSALAAFEGAHLAALMTQIQQAIDPGDGHVLEMLVDGLPIHDIGRLLGWSEYAVKQAIARVREAAANVLARS